MIRIGVSGHRRFDDESAVATMTAGVIDRLVADDAAPVVLSSLAEGADLLVAELVLAHPGARLEVVLPLPADTYVDDFTDARSRERFDDLVRRASSVVTVTQIPDEARQEAYERAGRAIVDACDVLVALWDGAPSRGRGGTAEIIQYALDHDVMVELVLVDREDA